MVIFNRQLQEVLNAFRHLMKDHLGPEVMMDLKRVCSTPFGI